MSADDSHPLHPLIQELVSDIEIEEGLAVMAAAAFEAWYAKLAAQPDDLKETLSVHLAAQALKLNRRAGPAADPAVVQMAVLAYSVAKDRGRLTDQLSTGGVDVKRMAEVTGGAGSVLPPSNAGPPPEGAMDLLSLRSEESKEK